MNLIGKRNPILAALLSAILGPIGYVYIGLNYFISGIIISIVLNLVLFSINIPYPHLFIYIQFLFYAYYGYKFSILKNNSLITDYIIEESRLDDFGLTFLLISGGLFSKLKDFYTTLIGGYTLYLYFHQHNYFKGVLVTTCIYIVSWGLGYLFPIISIILVYFSNLVKTKDEF